MIIHLTTDKFWNDIYSIERWPEILRKLPQKIHSQSKVDVAKNYLNYKTDAQGRIVKADEVYGLFGLEYKKNKKMISGCQYIAADESGYCLSEEALILIRAYETNGDWELLLAQQLLTYSVRVRVLFFALLNGEGIYSKEGFMKNTKEVYIDLQGKKYFVLNADNTQYNLNSLLQEYPKQSLGADWLKILEIGEDEEIIIEGVAKAEPSLKQVGYYFRMPLMLFKHLGWFREISQDIFVLDKNKIKNEINSNIYNSLLLDGIIDEIDILRSLIEEYGDTRGYFPVSIVGELLKNEIEPFSDKGIDIWIDQYFMNGITKGIFKLAGREQGQPRHGRGLMGDKEQQMIKLMF